VLFLGASNIWCVPLSNSVGRRPILLAATFIMTLSTLWCALATSYHSILAARILQGIGGGAADTVAPALIGDVYFMDERGRAMVRLAPLVRLRAGRR
jgi:MFS family permease